MIGTVAVAELDPPTLRAAAQLDRRFSDVAISPQGDRRIRAMLRTGATAADRERPARGRAVFAFVAGAMAALLLVWIIGRGARVPQSPAIAQTPTVDLRPGFEAAQPQCRSADRGGALVLDGKCRLRLTGLAVELTSWAPSDVQRTEHGLAVRRGRVGFDVQPRTAGQPPVRIEVSGGTLVVVGTRFSIYESGTEGHVDLLEGALRFEPPHGEPVAIVPGRRFGWTADVAPLIEPPAPPPPADPAPPASADTRPSEPPPPPRARIAEASALRRAGRYKEAAQLLRDLAKHRFDRRTAEVLSFELGTVLEDGLHDVRAACEQWKRHAKRFAGGRYHREVADRQTRLGCPAS